MIAKIGTGLVIPYGSAGIRADVIARLKQGNTEHLEKPGAPVIVMTSHHTAPIRLSSIDHPFTRPPQAQELAHAATQIAFLEQHIAGLCGQFSKPTRLFVARYFAALQIAVRADAAALNARAGPLAGLVEIDHWCFSALMPLPRAQLYCPATDRSGGLDPGDFVPVDFAFWTGHELVAVIVSAGTVLPARRRALARLADAGVRLVMLDAALIERAEPAALLDALGSRFNSALLDQDLPASPFRGRAIPYPVAG